MTITIIYFHFIFGFLSLLPLLIARFRADQLPNLGRRTVLVVVVVINIYLTRSSGIWAEVGRVGWNGWIESRTVVRNVVVRGRREAPRDRGTGPFMYLPR
ncbi:hypothetical protein GGR55DRAFT_638073 [Xylaria sp. FL0064]|nr:hypothetical protein GGR55DRAFT_638073 [Xylaria sp. FL0064]